MKKLFETFQKTLYDPQFYRSVHAISFREVLRYYFKCVAVLAFLMTIAFAVYLVPEGVRFVKEDASAVVKKYYPAELVITFGNGKASANVPMPYFIPLQSGTTTVRGEVFQNLIVIDTQSEFEKKKFDEYKTLALLTKTELVTKGDGGRTTIQDIRDFPASIISQALLLSWVEKVRGALVYIVPIGVIITFVMLVAGYVVYLIPLFIFALIPYFLAWTKKIPLSYADAYKISMYAVMPGLVLKTLFNVSGFIFVPSYLSLLVFALVIFLNIRTSEESASSQDNNTQ